MCRLLKQHPTKAGEPVLTVLRYAIHTRGEVQRKRGEVEDGGSVGAHSLEACFLLVRPAALCHQAAMCSKRGILR